MSSRWKSARWTKNGKVLTGRWLYNRASDTFLIELDSIDPITGQNRSVRTHNDTPEWNDWTLIRDEGVTDNG